MQGTSPPAVTIAPLGSAVPALQPARNARAELAVLQNEATRTDRNLARQEASLASLQEDVLAGVVDSGHRQVRQLQDRVRGARGLRRGQFWLWQRARVRLALLHVVTVVAGVIWAFVRLALALIALAAVGAVVFMVILRIVGLLA